MSADGKGRPPGSLLAEFKRRKVVQFAIAYCLIAWLIVQVVDVTLPVYGAPDWAIQAIITILIVAFPPALVLAWLYNFTAGGVELTAESRWSARLRNGYLRAALSVVTLAVTGAAVWSVWHTYLTEQRPWIQIVDRNRAPVVAVAPISNLSGNAELDWLSNGLAALVRDRLAQSRHLVVVSAPRWQGIVRAARDPSERLALAAGADIDYVLSGELLSAPGGLILTTRITHSGSGIDLAAKADENLSAEQVLAAVYRISIMAKQSLKIPHEEQVDSFAADFAVSNFAAYRAYVSGLQFFLGFDYEHAKQSMQAALELAPDFHIARYRMAMIHWVMSERDQAADAMRLIPDDAALNARERGYVEAANAFIRDNDPAAAIERYRRLLEEFPYEVEARQYLAEAYFHDYQDEAAIAELRLLGEQEPENQFVWGSLGAYLTMLGRHDEARAALERYLDIAPNEANAHNLMGDLYRATGEFDLATGYFERALELKPSFTLSQIGLAEVKAALGDIAAAKERLTAVLARPDAEAEDRITAAFDLAWLLRAEGRFEQSTAAIHGVETELRAEQIRESMALALLSENALAMHDAAGAAQLIEQSIERAVRAPTRYLFSRALLELTLGRADDARVTAEQMREHALPPDDPDRTEDKAAQFIDGLVAMETGELDTALERIRDAIAMHGYRYAIYKRGLAIALHRSGDVAAARAMAAEAKLERDTGDIRLDLERERALAQRLEIRLARESGDVVQATALIEDYERRWGGRELADERAEPAAGLGATPE